MYFIFNVAALLTVTLASISVRRTGWLDRVVEYHKKNFYNDVDNIAPVKINVSLVPVPDGYEDSTLWTYDSVMHLLVLISESETAAPVRRALRRMMTPTRRLSREKSFKLFPSIMKYYRNEFYYDIESSFEYVEPTFGGVPEDDAVIMVSNPVEARLPSARISVRLLREILDARAEAARFMPTTIASSFSWKPMNKTGSDDVTEAGGSGSGDEADGSGEADTEAGSSSVDAAPAEDGAAPAEDGAAQAEDGAAPAEDGAVQDTF